MVGYEINYSERGTFLEGYGNLKKAVITREKMVEMLKDSNKLIHTAALIDIEIYLQNCVGDIEVIR